MTVAEAIEKLKTLPQDARFCLKAVPDESHHDFEEVDYIGSCRAILGRGTDHRLPFRGPTGSEISLIVVAES